MTTRTYPIIIKIHCVLGPINSSRGYCVMSVIYALDAGARLLFSSGLRNDQCIYLIKSHDLTLKIIHALKYE